MTREQRNTIRTIRARSYNVRVVKRIREGILLVRATCTYTGRRIPLRIYPNGEYTCPWYDSHNTHSRRHATWQH